MTWLGLAVILSSAQVHTTKTMQVLGNLTTVRSYFDLFSEKNDEETREIEEAELELEILQKVSDGQESSERLKPHIQPSCPVGTDMRSGSRLQQIKETIHSLEKAKIREEIMRRRQNKTLARQARQKRLEEAARREAELIQELDRERIADVEREIERQRALEVERVKTRELRHNLELEKERQQQRELQLELEQAESGLRSRREYPSSNHGGSSQARMASVKETGHESLGLLVHCKQCVVFLSLNVHPTSYRRRPTAVSSAEHTKAAHLVKTVP